MRRGLLLHQEVLLLALHDAKGTTESMSYGYAMGGGILAELLAAGRLDCERDGKKLLVNVADPTPPGDELLDEALARVRTAKRRGQAATWVSRFSGLPKLKQRVARQLVEGGILRVNEQDILFLFSRKVYPTLDPLPEQKLVERLRGAVLGDGDVDERTAILVGITYPTGLLGPVIGKKELKARKQRVEAIVNEGIASEATRYAIQAAQAAVTAAVMAAT